MFKTFYFIEFFYFNINPSRIHIHIVNTLSEKFITKNSVTSFLKPSSHSFVSLATTKVILREFDIYTKNYRFSWQRPRL